MSGEPGRPAIATHGLVRSYGPVQAVRGVDLSVHAGELYGLVGPDGAGKSTTLSCLAGLMQPTAGQVRVLGEDPLAPGAHVREHLGLMPQQYSLYGDLSVNENMRFFGRLFGLARDTYRERVERLLSITRLGPFVERRADALSGGMYKKLALACALLHRPEVLLLDEPTSGVDPVSRRELWELVYELVGEGMAVVVSTAYMDEAARCHRVGLLHAGKIVAEGTPRELTHGLDHEVIEVTVDDRHPLHEWLDHHPAVVTASPAGARLRVLALPEAASTLERDLVAQGATFRRVTPNFEDLFLARASAQQGAP